ncbi:MAG TPA: hypothetical protein VGN72_07645 [Tepidisphaeraceae bacterium]|jgi:hypothetical protein|nr:hypothetical protein [Tepidisphaeraceae bacterium]
MPADPFAQVRSLDAAALQDIASVDDIGKDLLQPWGDEPDFDTESHPEIDVAAKLSADRAMIRTPSRRLFLDYRSNPDAYRHLKRLPKEGQSLHGIISGRYALFDLVPALLERHKGEAIADLYLATLGFSKQNGADLCGMLDERHVRRVSLLVSYYFEKTSNGIYDAVVPELLKRGQRVKAIRTHCKLIVVRMTGGARYVCESSANLRSCQNIEQFVLTRCPRLYAFHRRWMVQEVFRPTGEQHRNHKPPGCAG